MYVVYRWNEEGEIKKKSIRKNKGDKGGWNLTTEQSVELLHAALMHLGLGEVLAKGHVGQLRHSINDSSLGRDSSGTLKVGQKPLSCYCKTPVDSRVIEWLVPWPDLQVKIID